MTEDVARLHRLGQHLPELESPDFSFNAGAYESGMLTAIARRASVLARERDSAGEPEDGK